MLHKLSKQLILWRTSLHSLPSKCNSIVRLLSTITSNTIYVPDRKFIEISGKDCIKFLQGICTNNLTKLEKHGDCIPAAFLNTKVQFDKILIKTIDKYTILNSDHCNINLFREELSQMPSCI